MSRKARTCRFTGITAIDEQKLPRSSSAASTSTQGSNDLGFARGNEGYFPIISDFDRRTLLDGEFLPRLRVAYAQRVVETLRTRLRASVRRTAEGSVIKLRVRY
jgi:hypothetical protein